MGSEYIFEVRGRLCPFWPVTAPVMCRAGFLYDLASSEYGQYGIIVYYTVASYRAYTLGGAPEASGQTNCRIEACKVLLQSSNATR
jgi:hypothetical protein